MPPTTGKRHDTLHRIRPLYDCLLVACNAVYHPDKILCVVERDIRNKPTKWGIKLCVLSDITGYTVDFSTFLLVHKNQNQKHPGSAGSALHLSVRRGK